MEMFSRCIFYSVKVTVGIIKILMHLSHTDSDIGTMICDSLQAGCNVRKHKSHLYCTFSGTKTIYMASFQLTWPFFTYDGYKISLGKEGRK